jgi:hypothetical protein
MRHDDWKARMFANNVIKEAVQKEIEMLALVVLGNNELKIDYNENGFESNVYCNSNYKQFCPSGKRKKYMGSWKNCIVFGNTKTDVYLEVLRCLANDGSLYIPIVEWNKDKAQEVGDSE